MERTIEGRMKLEGLIEGRIVHFVIPEGQYNAGAHRPAVIVRVWGGPAGYVNLHVFSDGTNDGPWGERGAVWETSVPYSEEPRSRTWHWIERA